MIGTTIGSYQVVAKLGEGGMGACGPRRASLRVEPPWRGGGAPRHFLMSTNLAHPGAIQWR